jgi:sec-independent protein translocase protein TatB
MFDVSASELLLTAVVAIVVIGPKDLPLALRTAGRWMGKIRRVSNHFRSGIETMIREAELQDMEAKWREQNAAIMAAHPEQVAEPADSVATPVPEATTAPIPEAKPEATPELPLAPPR